MEHATVADRSASARATQSATGAEAEQVAIDALFEGFQRQVRNKKNARQAFSAALSQYVAQNLARLSQHDPLITIGPSDEERARAVEHVARVRFLDDSSPWRPYADYMEINLHSLLQGMYEIDRVYWNFPATEWALCNACISAVYSRRGEKFNAVFVLDGLDHKQEIDGTVNDMDVFIDGPRDNRQIRVMMDLIDATTTQFAATTANWPKTEPLAERLAAAQARDDA